MVTGPLGWVVNNWRLKLLSLLLTAGVLGAVSFSENPPDFATVAVRVEWSNQPSDVVVMNPPATVDVQVAGLRSDVRQFQQGAAGVTVNLKGARPSSSPQTFYAIPKTQRTGVTVRQASIPVQLTIEAMKTSQLDVEVRTPNLAAGVSVIPSSTYATCGSAQPCQITVQGATSIVDNLKAFVNYDVTLSSGSTQSSLDEPVQFELNGKDIGRKFPSTLPEVSAPPLNVTVRVATQGGAQSRSVIVSALPQGTPACGYGVTSVDIQPSTVTVHGPIDVVSRLGSVSVAQISVAGASGNVVVNRPIQTGSSLVTADPGTVRVAVSVTQQWSCTPSTPSGSVSPSPSPAATPTVRPSP